MVERENERTFARKNLREDPLCPLIYRGKFVDHYLRSFEHNYGIYGPKVWVIILSMMSLHG